MKGDKDSTHEKAIGGTLRIFILWLRTGNNAADDELARIMKTEAIRKCRWVDSLLIAPQLRSPVSPDEFDIAMDCGREGRRVWGRERPGEMGMRGGVA